MSCLAIIGASGHGKVVADIASLNGFDPIVFFDDRWPQITAIGKYKVVGSISDAIRSGDYDTVVVAIGASDVRAKIHNQLERIASAIIHPTAYVNSSVQLGRGTVVMPGAILNSDTRVGEGVIINSGAIIEHDCMLGDFVHACPNSAIAGGVVVGKQSWLGIGCSVIQKVKIGNFVTVGAGAIVIKDISDNLTVIGNPAKPSNC